MKYLILLLMVGLSYGQWNSNAGGGNKGNIQQDASTHALITTEYEHHEIHSGSHYFVAGFSTVSSGDSAYFSVTTPNTNKWAHMVFDVSGSGILSTYVYEGSTVTGGAAVVPWNNNRNSSNTSVLTLNGSPSITSAGTCIDSSKVGSGPKTGGSIQRNKELILKQNTTYLYIFISGAASNIVSYNGSWYEHTNK